MNPYKLALLAGTHQHRWAAGICEKCGKTHSPHNYNANGNGICSICGYVCLHPNGWLPDGLINHKCPVCYKREAHTHELLSQVNACFCCPVCDTEFVEHTWDSNGNMCSVCGYVRFNLCDGAVFYVLGDSHYSGAYKYDSTVNGIKMYKCWQEHPTWNPPRGYEPVGFAYLAAVKYLTPMSIPGWVPGYTATCRGVIFRDNNEMINHDEVAIPNPPNGTIYNILEYREYYPDGEPVLTFGRGGISSGFPEIVGISINDLIAL